MPTNAINSIINHRKNVPKNVAYINQKYSTKVPTIKKKQFYSRKLILFLPTIFKKCQTLKDLCLRISNLKTNHCVQSYNNFDF